MAYTATALSRAGSRWTGRDVDLTEVADLDAVSDLMREDVEDVIALLFLEEDDEYVAIVRVDGDEDPRVFVSDRRVLDGSAIAGRLFADALPIEDVVEDDDEEEGIKPEAEPAGDVTLLEDLGTAPEALLGLCAEEGMLPADVIFAVCEKAGCLDVIEQVRGV